MIRIYSVHWEFVSDLWHLATARSDKLQISVSPSSNVKYHARRLWMLTLFYHLSAQLGSGTQPIQDFQISKRLPPNRKMENNIINLYISTNIYTILQGIYKNLKIHQTSSKSSFSGAKLHHSTCKLSSFCTADHARRHLPHLYTLKKSLSPIVESQHPTSKPLSATKPLSITSTSVFGSPA